MKYYRYTGAESNYGTLIYAYDESKLELKIIFHVGRWKIYTKGYTMIDKKEIDSHLLYAKEITEEEALVWCI